MIRSSFNNQIIGNGIFVSMDIAKVFIVVGVLSYAGASPPCGKGYGQSPCLYVPAKPGQTPSCANAGSTYCETIVDYPETLIKTLLKSYPTKDILTDESKLEFVAKKRFSYNVHHGDYFDHHGAMMNPDQFGNINYNGHGSDESSQLGRHNNYYSDSNSKHHGYQYPNPGSASSFHQLKPSSFNYGDYYHRTPRKADKEAIARTTRNKFLKNISPRNKRQVSANREQLCEIRANYINPQAALNSRGNWMYIVNGVETATQLVRTETCASTQCSNLCQLPNNYNSRCEQKYVQKRLIALDTRGEKLYNDVFWFPSCCVCTLSNN